MEGDRGLGALRMVAINVMEAMGAGTELPVGKMGMWERDVARIPDSDPIDKKKCLSSGVVL